MTDNNANWKKARIKDVSTPYTGNSIKDEHKDLYIDNINAIPYISTKDINDKFQTIDFDNGLFIKNSDKSFRRAPKNSTLLCIEGGNAGKKIAFNDRTVCFVNKLCCFHSKTENNKFLYYFLMSPSFTEEFKSRITGLIGGVSVSALRNIHIRLPALDEQEKIANFLDEKCAEIDKLSEDIQKQIDILNDYKKSVITRAVTKGLDPNAEMKDSGIEYIGEVPTKWNIHPIYYYFDERRRKNSGNKEQNLLSLSYGHIIRKDINTNGGLLPASFSTYNIVYKNDIIIRPTDLQNDKRSLRTGLVTERGIITSAYIDLRPLDGVNSEYYHYLLHAYDIMKVFYNMGNGVRQGLNYSEFSKLLVLEPSSEEQRTIVSYLNDKCEQINSIIAAELDRLNELQSYKKSIIYEYVTGKKRVKGEL